MEPKDMGAMDSTWLQAIHPRGSAAGEGCVKGAFQYNGGHGLTTFFVYVELAEPLRQQLARGWIRWIRWPSANRPRAAGWLPSATKP